MQKPCHIAFALLLLLGTAQLTSGKDVQLSQYSIAGDTTRILGCVGTGKSALLVGVTLLSKSRGCSG